MVDDAQTHALPVDVAGRERLASSMGYADWDAFRAALEASDAPSPRSSTARSRAAAAPAESTPAAQFESLWTAEPSLERVAEEVGQSGLADPEAAAPRAARAAAVRLLPAPRRVRPAAARDAPAADPRRRRARRRRARRGRPCRAGSAAAHRRGDRRAHGLPRAPERERAGAQRLVQICGMGDYLARQVAAHPLLLDELLDARVFEALPDRAQFARGARGAAGARRDTTRNCAWTRSASSAGLRCFGSRCWT